MTTQYRYLIVSLWMKTALCYVLHCRSILIVHFLNTLSLKCLFCARKAETAYEKCRNMSITSFFKDNLVQLLCTSFFHDFVINTFLYIFVFTISLVDIKLSHFHITFRRYLATKINEFNVFSVVQLVNAIIEITMAPSLLVPNLYILN